MRRTSNIHTNRLGGILLNITTAKTAGFCFGVNRAVDLVYKLVEQGKQVCTLGPIIHNQQLVKDLTSKGVHIIEKVEDAPEGSVVVIRSHGVGRDIYDQLQKRGIESADATCPFVSKIHRIVEERSAMGDTIFIAGDRNHPEVIGIAGHCKGEYHVFKNQDELEKLLNSERQIAQKNVCMVSQTTFNTLEWEKCSDFAKKLCTNLTIFDTICSATTKRQNEAIRLSLTSDLMIVVGGRHSSNTAKLKEVCEKNCRTVLIETADELTQIDFDNVRSIGLTAGASTPACIIKEVQINMSENLKNLDEDFNFEKELEKSFKSTYTGERVVGEVVGLTPTEVQIDIGTKHAGYVPLSELTADPNAKIEDLVKVGDKLDLIVLRVNDVEGILVLSKKRVDAIEGFEQVMKAAETGEILEGVVVDVVKGGVIAVTNGVRIFIPASQATASKSEPLEGLLKQNVRFKILEVNENRRRAIGSIRQVIKEERKVLEDKFWEEVEEGKVYTGTVKSLTSYGAFVDLGGVDGMIHISELSWNRIKHPSEVINVGDTVEVYVKGIDAEKKKISLGYKKSEDNPWEIFKRDYAVGSVVVAKIVSLTSFGAFAEILPGVDGLIHISQISTERINQPKDVLSIGEKVEVKITDIDLEKKRISLSIKALIEDKEMEEQQAEDVSDQEAAQDAIEEDAVAIEEVPGEE